MFVLPQVSRMETTLIDIAGKIIRLRQVMRRCCSLSEVVAFGAIHAVKHPFLSRVLVWSTIRTTGITENLGFVFLTTAGNRPKELLEGFAAKAAGCLRQFEKANRS